MERNQLIVICVCIIVCVTVICGSIVIVNNNNSNNDDSQANVVQNSTNGSNVGNNGSNSISSAGSGLELNSASFYSDGNPDTGESVTLNFANGNYLDDVYVTVWYYRDGAALNSPSEQSYKLSNDLAFEAVDNTPMPEYPDSARIKVRYNGVVNYYDFSLETRTGTQTLSP